MEKQEFSLDFDSARSGGVVLYDLPHASMSDPPLWNALGERHAWPPSEFPSESVDSWVSEREYEVEVCVLGDGLVLLKVFTDSQRLLPPLGPWDIELTTSLNCSSGVLGIRYISGKARATLYVSKGWVEIAVFGRYIDIQGIDYTQEFVLHI